MSENKSKAGTVAPVDAAAPLKDGAIFEDRSCTDIPCVFFFALFLVGWIVVIAVAFAEGNPEYIVRPTNYRGDICGVNELSNFSNYFVPIPTRYTYGLCVAACPEVLDYVCNNDIEPIIGGSELLMNTYYDHSSQEYVAGVALSVKCQSGTCTSTELNDLERYYGLVAKAKQDKCFPVVYSSGVSLYRCIPFGSDHQNESLVAQFNSTLSELAALGDTSDVSNFFTRGFSECRDSWLVIFICCISCVMFALLWVLLLRWMLAPMVYFCIIAVFGLLIGLGYLAYRMQSDFSDTKLPGDMSSDQQVILWKVLMYSSFALAAIYFVVMLWLLKRIRIAIVIMEEASKAFMSNPGLVIIPPFTAVSMVCVVALFVVVTVYIQTIGSLNVADFESAAVSVFGASAVNMSEALVSLGADYYDALQNETGNASSSTSSNATHFDVSNGIKGLHAYNFFMMLWATNFLLALGFLIMSLVVCAWYFSATTVELQHYDEGNEVEGHRKNTPVGTLLKAVCVTFRYHLGTLFFGAFLIALIQFVRAVLMYIQKNYLEQYKDNTTFKVVMYCIQCWLACIERIVKIISYNAFIVCAIRKNNGFLSCAAEALELLTTNILRVSMLGFLSTAACFLIKLFICCCNMVLAYFLIQQSALTDGELVESGLFPLAFILVISFVISSLFVNVFEVCVDSIMMCFLIDEASFKATFVPPSLAILIGTFTEIGAAREKYDSMVGDATAEKKATKTEDFTHLQ